MATKPRVLVPLFPGFEETEAITTVDYLRRAGAHVVTVSVDAPNPIAGRNRVRVMADIDLPEALDEWGDDWALVAIPGGPGVPRLRESEAFMGLLGRRVAAGQPVAAICAAPTLLAAAGLDRGRRLTSHPSVAAGLAEFGGYDADAAVVVDGPVVTSRGPGTAVAFALACVEALFGAERAAEIRAETVS